MFLDWRTRVSAIVFLTLVSAGCLHGPPDVLYQYSTIDALKEGVYDGYLTVGELKKQGDHGLGTFNALDGEMVVVDGSVYRVDFDGAVVNMPDSELVPFAAVNFFMPDTTYNVDEGLDYAGFRDALDEQLGSLNLFYAIRVEAELPYIKVRSVPRQERPYPPLTDVIPGQQSEFELVNVSGTLVGYRCPVYAKYMNATGYHLHFLTDDRTAGGHVLDFQLGAHTVLVDRLDTCRIRVPAQGDFLEFDSGAADTGRKHKQL